MRFILALLLLATGFAGGLFFASLQSVAFDWTGFGAIATAMAAIVALFKEEIQSAWRSPRFSPALLDLQACPEGRKAVHAPGSAVPVDTIYSRRVRVSNEGRWAALDCSIRLVKLEPVGGGKALALPGGDLGWIHSTDRRARLAAGDVDEIEVIRLKTARNFGGGPGVLDGTMACADPHGSEIQGAPAASGSFPCELIIGGARVTGPGEWTAVFAILSMNAQRASRFSIRITWDGKDHTNLDDQRDSLRARMDGGK